jgi:hypothetical protein
VYATRGERSAAPLILSCALVAASHLSRGAEGRRAATAQPQSAPVVRRLKKPAPVRLPPSTPVGSTRGFELATRCRLPPERSAGHASRDTCVGGNMVILVCSIQSFGTFSARGFRRHRPTPCRLLHDSTYRVVCGVSEFGLSRGFGYLRESSVYPPTSQQPLSLIGLSCGLGSS